MPIDHRMFQLLLKEGLYLTQRILDVGAGTGIWAIKMVEHGLVGSDY